MIGFLLFPVSTPEIFYERMLAFKQDPATGKPDPVHVKAFEERHPETVEVLKKDHRRAARVCFGSVGPPTGSIHGSQRHESSTRSNHPGPI
jgi:hypothetical protein